MPEVTYRVNLNTTRGGINTSPDVAFRRSEAKKHVKLFHRPKDGPGMWDSDIPDYLVSDSMIDRFLEIAPPVFRVESDFDPVIEEIERTYVLGLLFASVSAAVVTIERTLNFARIALHEYVKPKIKDLWEKGPTNEWSSNIDALLTWKYISPELAAELKVIYQLRCGYLHSGTLQNLEGDSLRAIRAAYELLNQLIGFPEHLFKITSDIECRNTEDPLFKVFYAPSVRTS